MAKPKRETEHLPPPADPSAFRELPYFYSYGPDDRGVLTLRFFRKNPDGTRGEEFFPKLTRR